MHFQYLIHAALQYQIKAVASDTFTFSIGCGSQMFTKDEHVLLRILVTNLRVIYFDIYAIPTMRTPYYQSIDSVLYQKFAL